MFSQQHKRTRDIENVYSGCYYVENNLFYKKTKTPSLYTEAYCVF